MIPDCAGNWRLVLSFRHITFFIQKHITFFIQNWYGQNSAAERVCTAV
jgi:hypothetical protein